MRIKEKEEKKKVSTFSKKSIIFGTMLILVLIAILLIVGKVPEQIIQLTKNTEEVIALEESKETGTEENAAVYNTRGTASVLVRHYIYGTVTEISDDVVILGKANDPYTTEPATDIPSDYVLYISPENRTGVMVDGQITVDYYYIKKATQVIVHHYEEGTINKLSENQTINGRVDDPYTTEPATDIPIKYEFSSVSGNPTGKMTENTIEITYYYKVKDSTVTVKFLEKDTNREIAEDDVATGKVDEEYETYSKVIDNFKLVGDSGNTTGRITVDPITVSYYYLQYTSVKVQHIDRTTGTILEETKKDGLVGDTFTSKSKNFTNYVLLQVPENETVTMTNDQIVLQYYYAHVSDGVIEKHVDVITGEILANASYQGNEGDPYSIPSREFNGYDLVEDKLPTNSEGTMSKGQIEVIYYYIYRTKVTAEYIDKITGEKIVPDVVLEGYEKDLYTTERKEFDGYDLIEVTGTAEGEMTKEEIVVKYYYIHRSAGVVENHYDIKTGEKLTEEIIHTGREADDYKTEEKVFEGYDLVEEMYPTNSEGKMTIEEIRVDYYYIKKTEVNVKYIDKVTEEEIVESINIPGHEGDLYTTEQKEIEGYDFIEVTGTTEGEMTREAIEVVYIYARPAKVIVNHIDVDTNELLTEEEIIEGHEDDEYETESKEIEYYKLVEDKLPENSKGKMTVEIIKDENEEELINDTTTINYYYQKMTFNLKVEKIISSIIVNGEERTVNKDFGKVEIHQKEIENTNVQVVYSIKVTNDSELSGKAKLMLNLPMGMAMRSEKNNEWKISETVAEMETEEIKPEETKEYKVVLEWLGGDSNVGTKSTVVEIAGIENEAEFEEINSIDNKDQADFIITISTGERTYIIGAAIVIIALVAIAVTLKIRNKKEN